MSIHANYILNTHVNIFIYSINKKQNCVQLDPKSPQNFDIGYLFWEVIPI